MCPSLKELVISWHIQILDNLGKLHSNLYTEIPKTKNVKVKKKVSII